MKWKFDKGDRATFTCTLPAWRRVGGVPCTVIRRLTEDEADFVETGPMYLVKLNGRHGKLFQAFEDELSPLIGE